MKVSQDTLDYLKDLVPTFYRYLALLLSIILVAQFVVIKAQQTQNVSNPEQYLVIINFLSTPFGSLILLGSFLSFVYWVYACFIEFGRILFKVY